MTESFVDACEIFPDIVASKLTRHEVDINDVPKAPEAIDGGKSCQKIKE